MPLPNLAHGVTRSEAQTKIGAQLAKGRAIRDDTLRVFYDQNDLIRGRNEKGKWVKYTGDLLEILFVGQGARDEFDPRGGYATVLSAPTFRQEVDELRESVDGYLQRLESIHERMDLVRDSENKPTPPIVELEKQRPSLMTTDKATRIYSMTQLDDAEKSRKSAKERFEKSDYLGVFDDAETAVETAVKALLNYLNVEYKNTHDVSDRIPFAIRNLEKRLQTTRFVVVRRDLAKAGFWLHVLCSVKSYFYGIKDVGVPAGDIFDAEIADLASACINVTDIVVKNAIELVWELAHP